MSKAVRLLDEQNSVGVGLPCVLLTDLDYKRWDGVMVQLVKGDKVYVDTQRGFACHGDDYFTIAVGEYISILPN